MPRASSGATTSGAKTSGAKTSGAKKTPPENADTPLARRILPVVGANIVARREELGMSQRALAEKADVDRGQLRFVESGERTATLLFLGKLATALNTTLHKLTQGV
ncbi:helix-turn-helix domain-containing protein [Mycolicibacterium goodii]|uniref:helix-turn-helix domain-containing protein n=1 Tax=Mycolicibacterium goodii TaxID=134601 RepID=UPI00093C92A3|nr:helix-turn-helix transcriptional regulator [Mycolicibacterium goodii]MBU8841532.1 helix-turn-helix transcriptional regulator [Mycolicibacterium goodii]OKH63609.1 hypothetical protein EB74_12685 [Mycobacterium sp. SWH-M5]